MHTRRAVKMAQNLSVWISRSNCHNFIWQDGNVKADVSWIFFSQLEAVMSVVSKFKSLHVVGVSTTALLQLCNHARLPYVTLYVPQNCVLIVIAHRGCWVGVLSRCGLVSVPVLEILSVGARPRLAPALTVSTAADIEEPFHNIHSFDCDRYYWTQNEGVIANRSCSFSEVVTRYTSNVSISGTKLLCFASVEKAHIIRSTVEQPRLNHLLFLHCHKNRVGQLDLKP